MKLWDIAKRVGSGLLRDVVPMAGTIIDLVNDVLPGDQKLAGNATGDQVSAAVASLPPEQRAEVMDKEFEVELTQIKESHSTVRVMLESDARNPHSTRPWIAKGSFIVVALVTLIVTAAWAYSIFKADDPLSEIRQSWAFMTALLAPLVTLLHAYFGILKTEHKNRLAAANGSATPSGLSGILSSILKRG